MKTSTDPRHQKRQKYIEELFTLTFHNQKVSPETKDIVSHMQAIDETITRIAPEFPIDKINKVDLAILRLAIYELQINTDAPEKVVIDEAIELAKEYGGDTSPSFVNGALGKLIKKEV